MTAAPTWKLPHETADANEKPPLPPQDHGQYCAHTDDAALARLARAARSPGAPAGVRNFPRVRVTAGPGECHRSIAVAKFLARRAAAERAARRVDELAAARKGKRKTSKPAWSGRPVQEAPELSHSPSVARPAAPPVRDVPARAHDLPVWTAARRSAAMRREHARLQPARPRPSRVLAEIVAEVAEAANP